MLLRYSHMSKNTSHERLFFAVVGSMCIGSSELPLDIKPHIFVLYYTQLAINLFFAASSPRNYTSAS